MTSQSKQSSTSCSSSLATKSVTSSGSDKSAEKSDLKAGEKSLERPKTHWKIRDDRKLNSFPVQHRFTGDVIPAPNKGNKDNSENDFKNSEDKEKNSGENSALPKNTSTDVQDIKSTDGVFKLIKNINASNNLNRINTLNRENAFVKNF